MATLLQSQHDNNVENKKLKLDQDLPIKIKKISFHYVILSKIQLYFKFFNLQIIDEYVVG